MSSTYNANPGNVSLSSSVSATIPSDGDPTAAATFNQTTTKLADYVEALRTQKAALTQAGFGLLPFSGQIPNTASATYTLFPAGGFSSTALIAGGVTTNTFILSPLALVVRGFIVNGSVATAGGNTTVSLVVNSVVQGNVQIVISAGAGGPFIATVGTPVTAPAGQTIAVQVANGAGLTTSLQGTIAGVLYTLA